MTPRARLLLRLFVVPCLALYGVARLRAADYWDLLDDVTLAIHEAGHLVFQPFGEQGMTLGGSLFQVIVPLAFVVYFLVHKQRYAAACVLAWVGASLLNVATYIGDARAQELPLLGGENAVHDWWYLLTEWDLLARDRSIANGVRALATLVWIVSAGGALTYARDALDAPDAPLAPAPSVD